MKDKKNIVNQARLIFLDSNNITIEKIQNSWANFPRDKISIAVISKNIFWYY